MDKLTSYNDYVEKINKFDESSLGNKLDYAWLLKNRVIPFYEDNNSVFIFACKRETNLILNIEYMLKKECQVHLIADEYLDRLLKYVDKRDIYKSNNKISIFKVEDQDETDNIEIIKYLNKLIETAIFNEVSDIHIEPQKDKLRIRFRINGRLVDKDYLPLDHLQIIITRIKVLGRLDLAERRLPQDGRITFGYENRDIDLRISTIPTIYGEKIVIRLLDSSFKYNTLESLGLKAEEIMVIERNLLKQNGMTLVVGPTGSGKTTTIYSILNRINSEEINITTLEDPCEYKIEGINQVQINPRQGLKFSNTLRNILRQDPDVIFIGELRDQETVETALRSAITGHYLLSTLHVKDSVSSINRLKDMGGENFLISSALNLVISQRLVRTLCPDCKEEVSEDRFNLGIEKSFKAIGCPNCINGYTGRKAVFEFLEIDDRIKEMINTNKSYFEILDYCRSKGFITMREKLFQEVINGTTSVEEIIKII